MSENMIKSIIELSDLIAISSREERVSNYISDYFKDTKYSVDIDHIGNVIVSHPNNKENLEKVIVFAHMDEIGLIVRKITEDGYIYFERLGGVNTQILPGTRFLLDGDKGFVEGVIGVQAHHFMEVDNKFKIPPTQLLYIDICASSKEEVLEKGIDVGTYAAFSSTCKIINEKYLRGKTLDNRMAVGLLLQIAKDLVNEELSYNLHFCFPVQEEFNIRGLMPVLRKIKPDISIGLDITPACDTPDLKYNMIKLNNGPAITCMNFHGGGTLAGVLPNKYLLDLFVDKSKKMGINLQKEIAPGVITENAFGIFENETGIKVVNLSIPTRYTHTPFETASISDIKGMYKLLSEVLKQGFSK